MYLPGVQLSYYLQSNRLTAIVMINRCLPYRNNHPRHNNFTSLCPDCKKVHQSSHKCKLLCAYCHDFHFQGDLVDNLCPAMYPFAKEQQQKHSYVCKNCKGEGSFLEQVQTIRYESSAKFEKRKKEWEEHRKMHPEDHLPLPQRRVLQKDIQSRQVDCQECGGRGNIVRMVECCKNGCNSCRGDKFTINPVWKKYRKQPIINQKQLQCSICLEEVQVGENKYMLHCKHQFHPECIFKWMKDSKKCPICRQHDFYLEGQHFAVGDDRRAENSWISNSNIYSIQRLDRLGLESGDDQYSF